MTAGRLSARLRRLEAKSRKAAAVWPVGALREYLDSHRAIEDVGWAAHADEFVKRLSDPDLKELIEALRASLEDLAGEEVPAI